MEFLSGIPSKFVRRLVQYRHALGIDENFDPDNPHSVGGAGLESNTGFAGHGAIRGWGSEPKNDVLSGKGVHRDQDKSQAKDRET
jgi:hypothetical protein